MNNLEGILNEQYLRLYDPNHWERINQQYQASVYIPGYTIIGSVDGPAIPGDALCLAGDQSVWAIPFIPMTARHATPFASSLQSLRDATEAQLIVADETHAHFGKELHFVQPLALGGSPTDPQNIQLVAPEIHAEACCFWNKFYFEKLKEQTANANSADESR
ncbi:hypothetical protein AB1L30_14155 [Bremerella sp. JC817]|uniref:hypothetical protein n=1 Tax=Bremerella sp. JC817 TaxID=3231756 RepID=UPI00345A5192